jgi:drug/metabolite transporter (DMT)-like permease
LLVSRLVGATITVLGIIGMSLFEHKQSNTVESKRTQFLVIGCVILATLAWGIWGLIDKQAVTNASILEFYLGKCIWDILFLSGVVAIFKKQGHEFSLGNARTWYFCGLSTLCLAIGAWAYLTALSRLSASYVISICACYPIGMYILAIIFLKEKFDSRQFASLAVAVAGAILVQLGRFG